MKTAPLNGAVWRWANGVAIVAGILIFVGCNGARNQLPVASAQNNSAPNRHDIAPISAAEIAAVPADRANTAATPHADDLMHQGATAYKAGDFGSAATKWERAAREYAQAGNKPQRCDALIDLAAAYQSLGSFKESADALNAALPLARGAADSAREVDILTSLAAVYTFTRSDILARQVIDLATPLAEKLGDSRASAKLLNAGGNLLAVQGQYDSAADAYANAAEKSKTAGDIAGESRGMTNQSLALLRGGKTEKSLAVNRSAGDLTASLPATHDKANLLITQGLIFAQSAKTDPQDKTSSAAAGVAYSQAANIAEKCNDLVAESFALGYQGEIVGADKRTGDALSLSRRALFLAQESRSASATYRWQWQIGRLLHELGQDQQAIDSYRAAISTLRDIRGDLANGYGNQAAGSSFRETVGPIYYEMADLLLRQADVTSDQEKVQPLLFEARNTVELLKSGELDDYFHQKCVSILGRKIEQEAKAGAAVVYLIPLPDRTEMLVSTAEGMTRFKSPVGSTELTAQVREFRERLEDRTSNRYLLNARKLYNWIIQPIEPTLEKQKIDTLIFVPDGALRTIPMSALNDGKNFLISKYAVAITPGLTLMVSDPGESANGTGGARPKSALQGGLSVSQIKGFAPLEFVPQELKDVHQLFPSGPELLNQTFTAENFRSEMNSRDFSFVHLASHAEFSHNEKDTFLLTYDKKLTLDDLSALIERHRFSNEPLELLALSACQTAAGDDRAALGLAGVAIRMGARTAVATLWSVNDQASAELIQRFYSSLSSDPKLSKAKAMQQAQLALLKDARYRHPCYWAPYLVIGNWL